MSNSQSDFIYILIGKKLSGHISKAENDALLDWINSSKDAKSAYEDIKIHWGNIQFSYGNTKLVSQEELSDMIWKKAF